MHSFTTAVFVAVICSWLLPLTEQQYTPDWASIDSRPLPAWYDDSKIGVFVNWGVYTVPSFSSEWYVISSMKHDCFEFYMYRFWWQWKGNPDPSVVAFMNSNYPPDWTYADFASQFRAELYGKYRSLFFYLVSETKFFSSRSE